MARLGQLIRCITIVGTAFQLIGHPFYHPGTKYISLSFVSDLFYSSHSVIGVSCFVRKRMHRRSSHSNILHAYISFGVILMVRKNPHGWDSKKVMGQVFLKQCTEDVEFSKTHRLYCFDGFLFVFRSSFLYSFHIAGLLSSLHYLLGGICFRVLVICLQVGKGRFLFLVSLLSRRLFSFAECIPFYPLFSLSLIILFGALHCWTLVIERRGFIFRVRTQRQGFFHSSFSVVLYYLLLIFMY